MNPEKALRAYRILFYLTVVIAGTAAFFTWRARQQVQQMDVGFIAKGRDKGYKFTVDSYGYTYKGETGSTVDEQVLMFGLYEKDRLFFMRDYLKNAKLENGIVMDAGANTGNHSFFLSRCVPQGKVHSFEPYPPVIQRFRANMDANPEIKNIVLHEVGVSDKEAELPFGSPTEDLGWGSFQMVNMKERGLKDEGLKLKVVPADAYLKGKENGPFVLIKIDVEGHEEPTLKGLKEILKRDRPLVVCEVSDPPEGTIDSFEKFKALFPENYEFMGFENDLAAAMNGKYLLRRLNDKTFKELSAAKLDAVAYPTEKAANVPQPR